MRVNKTNGWAAGFRSSRQRSEHQPSKRQHIKEGSAASVILHCLFILKVASHIAAQKRDGSIPPPHDRLPVFVCAPTTLRHLHPLHCPEELSHVC
jgi:hypothetical protein